MDIRMLPIRHVFERFPRLVRDLAREQGKEIELILEGEATRIDKAIIDEIGEPLVHLDPQQRGPRHRAAGGARGARQDADRAPSCSPPPRSRTTSSSRSWTTAAGIDAGDGADARPCERGLLKARREPLRPRAWCSSSSRRASRPREAITELSGRGVGLDVVLKSIERLNGLVEVETVPGVGTKFIIQLPLTLAIISALLIEVSGRTYAVPLGVGGGEPQVRARTRSRRISGRETLRIRDRIVPLLRLSRVFGLPDADGPDVREYAVIIGRGDKRVGVVVDRLRGQQEVVIKALDPAVAGAEPVAMAGATIMGDGRVVLILDVAALFDGKRLPALHGRLDASRWRPERMSAPPDRPRAAASAAPRSPPARPPQPMPKRAWSVRGGAMESAGERRPAVAHHPAVLRPGRRHPGPGRGGRACPRQHGARARDRARARGSPTHAPRAHNISFFAAPVREERKAVEATEHLATFFLGREEYGVDVRLVQEIIRVSEITPGAARARVHQGRDQPARPHHPGGGPEAEARPGRRGGRPRAVAHRGGEDARSA